MRIWSLHPSYLDPRGLVALWREALLAKHVLEGKTKGYRNHPQLQRFRNADDPVSAINQYLLVVYEESLKRGYNFDRLKIGTGSGKLKLTVTRGQVNYEASHLLAKLKTRNPDRFNELVHLKEFKPHPMFKQVPGEIEYWEKVKGPEKSH